MNPFPWLLFILVAAIVLAVVAMLAITVVKTARELPPRRRMDR